MVSLKVVHALKVYQHAKYHGPTFSGASFFIHLRNMNFHHFGMVEATGLCHLQWNDIHTAFH
jgi:hypothetical protein